MTELFIKGILSQELFESRICESIDDQFVVDYLYKEMLLERLLYGEPVTVPELRKLLRKKILNFEFIKLDGEIRPAKGTTMMKYIPQADHPKGIRPSSPKVATFFDMKKKEWRSVSQRSKEIVLAKDEVTGKPVVKVTDKGAEGADDMKAPDVKEPVTEPIVPSEGPELNVGDVLPFTVKQRKFDYQSGDRKSFDTDTFITITRKNEEGTWGKTAGSEIDILLTPERQERLGEPIKVGDEFEFAKLDKNKKKIFTTIEITRKSDEGFWGKTKDSDKDILLTNERLKRLHKLETEPEEIEPEVEEVPTEQPEITIDGTPPEAFEPFKAYEPKEPKTPTGKQPFGTIDELPAKPLDEPLVNVEPVLAPEPEVEEPINREPEELQLDKTPEEIEREKALPKIKPIEKGTIEKPYHFRNQVNGAGLDLNISPKDTIKKLKQLGPNWYLISDKEFREEQEKHQEQPDIPQKIKPKSAEKKVQKPIIDKNIKKNLGNIEAENI